MSLLGLFLGSGRSIARAGPGGAVMSIVIMGSVISSVISCVGEMTALMPVNAPMMEFPRRFLDRGVGFAVGWVYWCVEKREKHPILPWLHGARRGILVADRIRSPLRFAYAVLAADQLVAVSNTLKVRNVSVGIGAT
jgi:amino acid transporter